MFKGKSGILLLCSQRTGSTFLDWSPETGDWRYCSLWRRHAPHPLFAFGAALPYAFAKPKGHYNRAPGRLKNSYLQPPDSSLQTFLPHYPHHVERRRPDRRVTQEAT